MWNFSSNWQFFFHQIYPERYFQLKTEKVNIIIEFRMFKLVLVPNIRLNWQFWFFWPNLPKKGLSGLKHTQISLVQNFGSNWQSEHHHVILHIWITLGQNFSLNTDNFEFLDQIYPKNFQSKTEQAVQRLQAFAFWVINVNSALFFKHFEDLKDLIIWTFWKKNWLYLA